MIDNPLSVVGEKWIAVLHTVCNENLYKLGDWSVCAVRLLIAWFYLVTWIPIPLRSWLWEFLETAVGYVFIAVLCQHSLGGAFYAFPQTRLSQW